MTMMRHCFRKATLWIAVLATALQLKCVLSFQALHHHHGSPSRRHVSRHPSYYYISTQQHSSRVMLPSASPSCHRARNKSHLHVAKMPFKTMDRSKRRIPCLGADKLIRRVLPTFVSKRFRSLRKKVVAFAAALLICIATTTTSSFAVTGGRMGGSFDRSSSSYSRPSIPSTSSSRSSSSMNSMRPQVHMHSYNYGSPPGLRIFLGGPRPRRVYSSRYDYDTGVATRFSTSDVVLLTGTGALIAYGVANNYRNNNRRSGDDEDVSALGSGASLAAVTVSLQVPNRDDPNSILNKLRRLSERADTRTRKGVQDLVSEVSLELLRQEKSIVSASTQSEHFSDAPDARREFQRQSIRNRSKFDRERVNKFGGEDRSETSQSPSSDADNFIDPKATAAVVSINLAIEGDSTLLRGIRYRQDLLDALSKIASDAQVDDCLFSAEVLWAPEERWEVLTKNDIYADYPNLIPF